MQEKVNNTQTFKMSYVISDHLGSIWALANESGGFIEQYAYDACSRFVETCGAGLATKRNPVQAGAQRRLRREGRRMNSTNWSLPDNRTTFLTDRGFTLHSLSRLSIGKHYDHMQIINMQARMYDPLMGQFISVRFCSMQVSITKHAWQANAIPYKPERSKGFVGVDPLADKYPGWGPYVYCMNNPLIYVDPTGEYWEDWNEASELYDAISDQMDKFTETLIGMEEDGGYTDEEMQNIVDVVDELSRSLEDIILIAGDTENAYSFSQNDDNSGKRGVWMFQEGKVSIDKSNDNGIGIHEMRHIGQRLRLGESITKNNFQDGKLGEKNQARIAVFEMDAHKAQLAGTMNINKKGRTSSSSSPVNKAGGNMSNLNLDFIKNNSNEGAANGANYMQQYWANDVFEKAYNKWTGR